MNNPLKFWEHKSLDELSDAEWESLCDGCGRCCLHKLEDEDSGEIHYTDVACKLLDTNACQCTHYKNRFEHVPDCLQVRPLDEQKLSWLPASCAYVKLARGLPLADWHPLISGDPASVQAAGIAVGGRCFSEESVPVVEWQQHLIVWAD